MTHRFTLRLLALCALGALAGPGAAQTAPLPNPMLYLTGTEVYSANGTSYVRSRYDVFNQEAYPAAMCAPPPNLPPCGQNANSSRSWVDFFDGTGRRLYGFCALGNASNLGQIWFALPEGEIPPSYVYIEINDRQTNTKYRSNLADSVM